MMLGLSGKMLFAIEAVLDIAYHAGSAPVQSSEISRRQGISRRHLEQALQRLARHGVLIGVRGPRGGYRLARERRRISVGDIVRAVGAVRGSVPGGDVTCNSELGCQVLRPVLDDLQTTMMGKLDTISVEDLCTDAYRANITSEGRSHLDFTI